MHLGLDTIYYRAQGYSVVAIEADPAMVAGARAQLAAAGVVDGVTIVQKAIHHADDKEVDFYLSAMDSEWSSLIQKAGSRYGSGAEKITVPTVTLCTLIREHCVEKAPHYIKIDIEGSEPVALASLLHLPESMQPHYISAELNFSEVLGLFERLGYGRFKLVAQQDFVTELEVGGTLKRCFHSGPFGDEAVDVEDGRAWSDRSALDAKIARHMAAKPVGPFALAADVRNRRWFDVHAAFGLGIDPIPAA
ncbi:S-adenosyl-L-methionine-dependent methyltransferase [Pavlovales sp. CCMP2436]|nr:S-adenosyl-L-methionine-dependent methyltransferase [Pavlovales sp. CCMP2436]